MSFRGASENIDEAVAETIISYWSILRTISIHQPYQNSSQKQSMSVRLNSLADTDAPPWTRTSFILSKRHLKYLESVNQADVKPSFLSTLEQGKINRKKYWICIHLWQNLWNNVKPIVQLISYFHNHKTMLGYIFIIGFKPVPRVKDWYPKAESVNFDPFI